MSTVSLKSVLKKHRIFFITFIIFCGILLFYFIAAAVLSYFNLQFTNYILYAVFAVCALLAVGMLLYGIVLCFRKNHVNVLYRIGSVFTICLLCVFLFAVMIVVVFGYKPIHIVEKNGEKMVANVTVFLSTRYVKYYDYKNVFVCGKQVRIKEDFTDGTKDPVLEHDEVLWAYYYNADGSYNGYYENPDLSEFRY